jgi:hypothetical protein
MTKELSDEIKIKNAVEVIESYGHHKQWVIDKVVRILLGNKYEKWCEEMGGEWAEDKDG